MIYDEFFKGFKELVDDLAGVGQSLTDPITESITEGRDQSQSYPPESGLKLNCKILRSRKVGPDELRSTYTDSDNLVHQKYFGNRILTVEVSATWEYSDDDHILFQILENVRSRLDIERNRATLRELGVSIAEAGDLVDESFVHDDHVVQAGSFTLTLNSKVEYEDAPETTIDQVNLQYEEPS